VAKKLRVVGVPTNEELDTMLDMALIFDGEAIVHLRDDYKAVKDLVVGDEVLGWHGEYRTVTDVYRPKFFNPPMLKYGIGVQVVSHTRDKVTYLEVGEQTKIASRLFMPEYEIVHSGKKARDINLHSDKIEICNENERGAQYAPATLLKLTQKLAHGYVPWLIGVDGLYMVVNDIVVMGFDSEKIRKFIRKEEAHAKRIKTKARVDVSETDGLRKDTECKEPFVDEDSGFDY